MIIDPACSLNMDPGTSTSRGYGFIPELGRVPEHAIFASLETF
jgi:hypothetical protein